MKIQQVDDIEYGVYVWRTDDGKYVTDADYNYMMIQSKKGDQSKIAALAAAARAHGVPGGQAEFRSGQRPVSKAEYEYQKEREAAGHVPDPYDLGNMIDEYRFKKEFKDD